jgi:phenylpyruvate tautomerase PptA (4-oxalocrotonate tautomerase family)
MPTVIVYWSPGRTDAQKSAVARGITRALVDEGGAKVKDVLVIFQNILPGDALRGSQIELDDAEAAAQASSVPGISGSTD